MKSLNSPRIPGRGTTKTMRPVNGWIGIEDDFKTFPSADETVDESGSATDRKIGVLVPGFEPGSKE